MTTTFETAKVGDRVWSVFAGWGVIDEVRNNSSYPIVVEFENGDGASYTFDGKEYKNDTNQSLFWDEIKFEVPKKPMLKLDVNTKVLVWDGDNPNEKHKRHFSHFENGRIYTFFNGCTSFSCTHNGAVAGWDHWELA